MLKDILEHQILATCDPDSTVSEVSKIMADRNVGNVLVLTNGRPRGILTDRDIVVRCIAKNIDVSDCTVEQIMSESMHVVKDTDGIFDCIKKMHEARVRRMPVVNQDGKAIGIVSFGDLLAVLSKEFMTLAEANTPLEQPSDKPQLKAV